MVFGRKVNNIVFLPMPSYIEQHARPQMTPLTGSLVCSVAPGVPLLYLQCDAPAHHALAVDRVHDGIGLDNKQVSAVDFFNHVATNRNSCLPLLSG